MAAVAAYEGEAGEPSPGAATVKAHASAEVLARIDPKRSYTVIRDVVYDVTDFKWQHPGGAHLLALAVGRDSTILYESHHIRQEVADRYLSAQNDGWLKGVTVKDLVQAGVEWDFPPAQPAGPAKGFGEGAAEFPFPGDSEIYEVIRKRVYDEVLVPKGRKFGRGGSEVSFNMACTLAFYLVTLGIYVRWPSTWTSVPFGLAMAWIGLGIQHTANHGGGAEWPLIGYLLGLTDDLIGGSSLKWRFHHQVSHHIYCNDLNLDMDAYTSFPILRMDARQPWSFMHAFQWLYAWVLFPLYGFAVFVTDPSIIKNMEVEGVRFLGASVWEKVFYFACKAMCYYVYLILPWRINPEVSILDMAWCFFVWGCVGSLTLSTMFIVSHNIEGAKPNVPGGIKDDDVGVCKDWAKWQIETSTSWGGRFAAFFVGGLNLQIEHHLFPGVAHSHYPDIQPIVMEECAKRGVRYHKFDWFLSNLWELQKFLWLMSRKPKSA